MKRQQNQIDQQQHQNNDDIRYKKVKLEGKANIFNRKKLRKEKRNNKKQSKEQFYKQSKEYKNQEYEMEEEINEEEEIEQVVEQQQEKKIKVKKKKVKTEENVKDDQLQQQLLEDEEMIKHYENLLGGSKNKKKINRKLKEEFEGGIFDLLDNIELKVKSGYSKEDYANRSMQHDDYGEQEDEDDYEDEDGELSDEDEQKISLDGEEDQESIQDQGDDDDEEEEDDYEEDGEQELEQILEEDEDDYEEDDQELDEEEEIDEEEVDEEDDEQEDEEEEEEEQDIEENEEENDEQQLEVEKENKKKQKEQEFKKSQDLQLKAHLTNLEDPEVHKQVQSRLNRLSEGNLENMFNQIVLLFEQHPFQVVSYHIAKVSNKLLLEVPNNLQSIIQTMCALLVGLYQLHDMPFLQQVFKTFIQGFQNQIKDNEQKGLHKFEGHFLIQMSHIISYFYIYDAVSIDFVFSFIDFLLMNLSTVTLDVLLRLLQNIGMKIRSDNPGKLKNLIQDITTQFESQNQSEKTKNTQFILDLLNDIKLNKYKNDLKEKLIFLVNFIQKRVIQKFKLVSKCFPADFKHCFENDFSKKQWYQTIEVGVDSIKFEEKLKHQDTAKRSKLEQLAVQQKMITDTRKLIFITLMESEDYADAVHKLLKIKLNKAQKKDIALVIVNSCGQEQNFNKFYFLVAQKLIEIEKNFRYVFQFVLWNNMEQIQNYTLRKIYNFAKLWALLVGSNSIMVQSLKCFTFESLQEHQLMFLKVFFKVLSQNFETKELRLIAFKFKEQKDYGTLRAQLIEFLESYIIPEQSKAKSTKKEHFVNTNQFMNALKLSSDQVDDE